MTTRPSRAVLIGGGLLAVAALLVGLVLSGAGGGDDGRYQVRAIFDNAVNVIPGEDVKIAGVKVGTISDLAVEDNRRAAVVLDIEAKGFQDFRSDATCTINAQSLIGEKFIACTPTRPSRSGVKAPPLAAIPSGQPGAGQHLIPITQTTSPVDPDLIASVMREPGPQRLRVILNELGTGFGARGEDLRTAIRRADPALAQTDAVLKTLADQNATLVKLAVDSDAVLAPFARERSHVTGAIRSIGATAAASASERVALAESLRRFPAFLRELVPTTDRLGRLADAGTPLVTKLGAAAPGLNKFAVALQPFAKALDPWFDSLGKTAVEGTKTIPEAKPAIDALTTLATNAGPTLKKLGSFLGNVRYAGGVENFLDLIYNSANAANGFDDVSHFIRGTLVISATCATYAIQRSPGCNANFIDDSSTARSAARAGTDDTASSVPRDAGLLRAAMVFGGSTPQEALRKYPDPETGTAADAGATVDAAAGTADSAGGEATPASADDERDSALLDFLLKP